MSRVQPREGIKFKEPRPIARIASEINAEIEAGNWSRKASAYAAPYLKAMMTLNKVTDTYYHDSAESIIRYFLANASTWRGETARRIKAELGGMVK